MIGTLFSLQYPEMAWSEPGKYALIGSAAMLGGVVRMTISLTVIIIEATGNITYGLPIMVTVVFAKWVGDYFNEGLYDIHIELKHVPLLAWDPPTKAKHFLTADDLMSRQVVCLYRIVNVGQVRAADLLPLLLAWGCVVPLLLLMRNCLAVSGTGIAGVSIPRMLTPFLWPLCGLSVASFSHSFPQLYYMLSTIRHQAFPIIEFEQQRGKGDANTLGTLNGIILRHQLMMILRNRAYGDRIHDTVRARRMDFKEFMYGFTRPSRPPCVPSFFAQSVAALLSAWCARIGGRSPVC